MIIADIAKHEDTFFIGTPEKKLRTDCRFLCAISLGWVVICIVGLVTLGMPRSFEAALGDVFLLAFGATCVAIICRCDRDLRDGLCVTFNRKSNVVLASGKVVGAVSDIQAIWIQGLRGLVPMTWPSIWIEFDNGRRLPVLKTFGFHVNHETKKWLDFGLHGDQPGQIAAERGLALAEQLAEFCDRPLRKKVGLTFWNFCIF